MDDIDRQLLNILQSDFPLVSRPFLETGKQLGLDEEEILARVIGLKRERIIRQIGAIFDTPSLGYRSSLVAMKINPERIDEAAKVINQHPGVSHNYARNHSYNLWFTVTVPPQASLEETVERLGQMVQAVETRLMPTIRLFKIGVKLDMTGESDLSSDSNRSYTAESHTTREKLELSPLEIRAIKELQEDLPLVAKPFASMAERLELKEEELLEIARMFIKRGQMRRFAAVLHHRKAGFGANTMAVWVVPEERIEEVGKQMATFKAVSHCYQRPVYPDWPYSLFTMIHGHDVQECQKVAEAISEKTGIRQYDMLYSTKEYKKTRVKYFTEDLEKRERENLS